MPIGIDLPLFPFLEKIKDTAASQRYTKRITSWKFGKLSEHRSAFHISIFTDGNSLFGSLMTRKVGEFLNQPGLSGKESVSRQIKRIKKQEFLLSLYSSADWGTALPFVEKVR